MTNSNNVYGQGNNTTYEIISGTKNEIYITNSNVVIHVTSEECLECKRKKENEVKGFFKKIVHFLESIHLITWLINSVPWVLLSLLPFAISALTPSLHHPILHVISSF